MNTRVHVFVSGKVQGVSYRSGTKDNAQEMGLTGWVRNLEDGRVEAVFEGTKERVEKMVKWCRKGPDYAVVKDMEIRFEEYTGEFKKFAIIRY
ncbi:Acylphosphatase [uncultured archaeon]|nr:Acylphosphatase [uncultured archaeon]